MSSTAHPPAADEKIDIRKYFLVLRRRKWWGIIPFVLLALVFTTICIAVPPKYQASCVIRASKSEVAEIMSGVRGKPVTSIAIVNEQMLRYDAVMAALANAEIMSELERKAEGEPEVRARLVGKLYNRVRKNTTITSIGKTLMQINYLGDTPQHAKDVLSRLVTQFVEYALERESGAITRARNLALGGFAQAEEALESLDSKLVTFREDHPGVSEDREGGKRKDLEEATEELERRDGIIDATRRKLEHYVAQLENMPTQIVDEVTTRDNPEVVVLRKRMANLRSVLAMSLKTFTPLHPQVKTLQQQIQVTEEELARAQQEAEQEEIKLTRNAVREQLEEKKLELEAHIEYLTEARRKLKLRERRLKEDAHARPGLQKELTGLHRERSAALSRYQSAHEKLKRVEEEHKLKKEGMVSFTVADPAREPREKDIKHKVRLAFMGLFVSLAIAAGAIAGTEFLDQSFTDVESARATLRLPSLGVIPYIETPGDRRSRRIRYIVVSATTVVVLAVVVLAVLFIRPVTGVAEGLWYEIKELCKALA